MVTVSQLLDVRQVAMASGEAHHGCLRVVQGGGLGVEGGGAGRILHHAEVLQLGRRHTQQLKHTAGPLPPGAPVP